MFKNKLFLIKYYFSLCASLAIFIVNNAYATNIIDNGGATPGGIQGDAQVQMWVSAINWLLSAGGGVFAAILGFGALKHIKHGEYGPGLSGLTASALAGGITYFVHTFFIK